MDKDLIAFVEHSASVKDKFRELIKISQENNCVINEVVWEKLVNLAVLCARPHEYFKENAHRLKENYYHFSDKAKIFTDLLLKKD